MRNITRLITVLALLIITVAAIFPSRAAFALDQAVNSNMQYEPVATIEHDQNTSADSAHKYGAIAYSTSTGWRGWSFNFDTRVAAEYRALAECGLQDCVIAAWFRDSYGAFARADYQNWGADWGNTRAEAEQKALQRCRYHASNPRLCGISLVVHAKNGVYLE